MVEVVDLDAVVRQRRKRAMVDSGATAPRFTAAGWAKTVTPPAAFTSRTASKGSSFVLRRGRPSPVAQPHGREGVGDSADDAQLDERGGDVRAADRTVDGEAGDLFPGDREVEGAQLADHLPGAQHTGVEEALPGLRQLGVGRVEEVREQVHAHAVHPAGQLGPGDEREALGSGDDEPPHGVRRRCRGR
ncbi:hypothetical protein SCALM49S_00014 [Streptomyces californicus]